MKESGFYIGNVYIKNDVRMVRFSTYLYDSHTRIQKWIGHIQKSLEKIILLYKRLEKFWEDYYYKC
mgnify:CR=1 FL=1